MANRLKPPLRVRRNIRATHERAADENKRVEARRQRSRSHVSDQAVSAELLMFMVAAPDTTSSLINALMASILSAPQTLSLVRAEIAAKAPSHGQTHLIISWRDIEQLPYFMACVQETARLYPPIPFILPRCVSAGDLMVNGCIVPEGAEIGAAAAVINQNEEIFGSAPGEWRPERWLVDDAEVRRRRQRLLFSWGSGTRSCLGKNLALLQSCKLVAHVRRV
ncbi:MAG: hypothetical protein Q9160_008557 [Pyrenula sp. 1 TL-2023]